MEIIKEFFSLFSVVFSSVLNFDFVVVFICAFFVALILFSLVDYLIFGRY